MSSINQVEDLITSLEEHGIPRTYRVCVHTEAEANEVNQNRVSAGLDPFPVEEGPAGMAYLVLEP